jgi:hypothetical protein
MKLVHQNRYDKSLFIEFIVLFSSLFMRNLVWLPVVRSSHFGLGWAELGRPVLLAFSLEDFSNLPFGLVEDRLYGIN